jgi:histone acetyltransferase (RNA polymerase elongator complex component)
LSFENNLIESNKFIDVNNTLSQYKLNSIPNSLAIEIKNNETSLVRIIGLTPETRPDQVTTQTLLELRNIGATRLQLGIQHINDKILKYVKRNCYTEDTIRAIKILKDNGFKVDGHFMPDLPNPNNELDMKIEDKKC